MSTPTSLQRLAKRRLLELLKADAGILSLVPQTHINPDGSASFPFILIASPRTLRLRSACVRGATVSFDVHAFAGPRESGGAVVETGEDHIARIGSAIETVFADNRLVLTGGAVCKIEFSDMQLLPDDEPDHWHWISQLNCRVLAE